MPASEPSETPSLTVPAPDVSAITPRAKALIAQATALQVTNVETHGAALSLLANLKTQERAYEDALEEPTKAAHKLHKWLTGMRARLCDPLVAAANVLKPRILAHERKAREEAERAERAAREEAERAERERRAADEARAAEEKRKADEAAAAAKRDAEAARAAGDAEAEELAALEEAEAAEAGRRAQAERAAIKAEPVTAPAVVRVAPAVATVAGVSARTTWKARVVDPLALLKHVAANPEWLNLVKFDEAALNALARTQKDRLALPGVQSFEEQGFSVRSGA